MTNTQTSFLQIRRCGRKVIRSERLVFVCVLLCFLIAPLSSNSAESDPTGKKDHIPLIGETAEKQVDDKQQAASALLIGAAEWLDSFYDDGPTIAEQNETRATLKLEFGYTDNEGFEFKPRLKVRLKIPKLTKKASLIITAADDEDFEADGNPASGPGSDDDRDKLTAALQFFVKDGEKYNISTSVGGSYDYLYAGIRFRHLQSFGKWQGRFTDRLRYYTDDGWENRASYYLERQFSDRWMFRSITSATWQEERDGLPYSQIFRMYQVLNEERALLYEGGAYFDTEPENSMTDLQFKVRYRERFYRDWLVFEIAPQITFPEDHDRDANPGIIFKLEADFGYISDRKVFDRVFDF